MTDDKIAELEQKVAEANCSVAGCVSPPHGRSLCNLHHRRLRLGKDLLAPPRRSGVCDPTLSDWLRPRVRHVPVPGRMIERFMDRIVPEPNSGCWLWLGGADHRGAGSFMGPNNKSFRAARLAYEIFVGPIADGLFACHHCDNPSCVNPDHLWLGDHRANMADMVQKGRQSRHGYAGEANPKAKLTAADVLLALRDPRSHTDLARLFGVAPATIRNARAGRKWKTIRALGVSP